MPGWDTQGEVEVPDRFVTFYRSEYPSVVALIYALTASPSVAEDLAQECFLRAHREWTRVAAMDSPTGWVRRVAVNLARSRWRRVRAEAAALARLSPAPTFIEPPAEFQDFWDEVRRLPARQAQAIALHYLDDLSVTEIGQVLDIADGTVKALLSQGRERLRRELARKGLIDDEV